MHTRVQQQQQLKSNFQERPHKNAYTIAQSTSAVHPLLVLQRTIGNQAVQKLLQAHEQHAAETLPVHTSRAFGHDFSRIPVYGLPAATKAESAVREPDAQYEREAEEMARIAEINWTNLHQRSSDAAHHAQQAPLWSIAGGESTRGGAGLPAAFSRVPGRTDATAGATSVETAITQERGRGHALPSNVRGPMEEALQFDFSQLRIHRDAQADMLNRQLNARAFTTGRDIFFSAGEYAPESATGRKLLVHELTHVVQQHGATGVVQRQPQSSPNLFDGPDRMSVTDAIFTMSKLADEFFWPTRLYEMEERILERINFRGMPFETELFTPPETEPLRQPRKIGQLGGDIITTKISVPRFSGLVASSMAQFLENSSRMKHGFDRVEQHILAALLPEAGRRRVETKL